LTRRHTILAIAGLFLAVVGVMALWLPVHLDQYDAYGIKVNCGNGLNFDIADTIAVHGGDFADKCDRALLIRRAWAIPAVALGSFLFASFLLTWARCQPPEVP
jgi:drug/metabolite transporter (DMT)-like permease